VRRDIADLLFVKYDLDDNIRNFLSSIHLLVDEIPEDQFHISSDDDIVRSIKSKKEMSPVELHEDRKVMDQSETKMDVAGWPGRYFSDDRGPCLVPGTRVTVTIPFTGDAQLWHAKTNPYNYNPPRGEIRSHRNTDQGGNLVLDFTRPTDEGPEVFKGLFEETLVSIRQYLTWSKEQIVRYNNELEAHIRPAIAARRARLKQQSGIADLLGIPLRRKDEAPLIEPIKVQQRIVVELPPVPKTGLKPEPGIPDKLYNDISSIIRHEGRTFESTPRTYRVHDEEELRDIMLAHLNGYFKGAATGEAFRRSGKTDIRIEQENRAAFVAECKVWRGAGELTNALNQLTSYLTWRDCKAAVIIFNKEVRGFTELVEDKVPTALKAHPRFVEMLSSAEAGEWRCIFRSQEDEGRRIHVRVFLLPPPINREAKA
jgi:hypothetical protein